MNKIILSTIVLTGCAVNLPKRGPKGDRGEPGAPGAPAPMPIPPEANPSPAPSRSVVSQLRCRYAFQSKSNYEVWYWVTDYSDFSRKAEVCSGRGIQDYDECPGTRDYQTQEYEAGLPGFDTAQVKNKFFRVYLVSKKQAKMEYLGEDITPSCW